MSSKTAAVNRPARKARRKLNSPLNLALAAILIALVAFWLGGMLQDGEASTSSPTMPSGFPGGPSSTSGSSESSGTSGEVTGVSGNTLYVSTSEGTTVEVKVKQNATVTRNAEVKAKAIHPGDSVTVSGEANKRGVVKADAVTAIQSGVEMAAPPQGIFNSTNERQK